jgi:kinesin family member 17
MQGPKEPASQRGIIPRALEQLFEAAAVSTEAKFLLTSSFLEIHNEEIRDLLNQANKNRLELREHPERGVYVVGKEKINHIYKNWLKIIMLDDK